MNRAPIAFFAYNRPEHARRALESLAANDLAGESELYIYSDGARGERDSKAVGQVRELIKSRSWCGNVHIIERERNLGLAGSIIGGVTEIVKRHGRIIVLEDDLVLSPRFLNFMNDALEFYENSPKVMHVSGYMFPIPGDFPDTFFYRVAACWGWATWRRAWDKFESSTETLLSGIDRSDRQWEFDVRGTRSFYRMLKKQGKGRIDSWAIRWYASVFLNGGLALYPRVSFVRNAGMDNTGRHSVSTDAFDVGELNDGRQIRFASEISENEDVLAEMGKFYRSIETLRPAEVFNRLKLLMRQLADRRP